MENGKYTPEWVALLLVRLFGALLGMGATVWLFIIDWRIGLAVFLMLWGNNMQYISPIMAKMKIVIKEG